MEQQTDKFFGGRGGIPPKKIFQRISTNWKNSPKQKYKGATFLSCPPSLAAPLLSAYLMVTKLIDFSIRIDFYVIIEKVVMRSKIEL